MRVSSIRVPSIGDKFATKNAQKGTCGMLYRQEDMPFTLCFDKDGNLTQTMIPDFIINPNAIPSRMTIAQMIEGMVGKYAARKGIMIDGTPFCDIDIEQMGDLLEECGFNRYGDHIMINGQTGKEFAVTVFIGPCFYQRLKHLVFDKIHSRALGPRQALTHQPTEGRARDGGFRFGVMECDCLITHGVAQFLKEIMLEKSDIYKTYVCDVCGLFAQKILDRDVWYCPVCPSTTGNGKNNTRISSIIIPYAFKLLMQELMALHIAGRIEPRKTLFNQGIY